MDEETRIEIEVVKNRISELASFVRTLQQLIQYHDEEIKALAVPSEEERHVYLTP